MKGGWIVKEGTCGRPLPMCGVCGMEILWRQKKHKCRFCGNCVHKKCCMPEWVYNQAKDRNDNSGPICQTCWNMNFSGVSPEDLSSGYSKPEIETMATKISTSWRNKKTRDQERKQHEQERKQAEEEIQEQQIKDELAQTQGYTNYSDKIEWEELHTHENFFSAGVLESYQSLTKVNIGLINQFSKEFTQKAYDVYNPPSELDYKSLLEIFEPCGKVSQGGESKVLFTMLKSTDYYNNVRKCLSLGSNEVVLLYKESKIQGEFSESEISKSNGVSIFMFPGYVRHLGCVRAPQARKIKTLIKQPIIYEILASEGPESEDHESKPWEDILDKSPLQWFQTIIFRFYIYNCGILRQEDKTRNWTVFEPKVGDLYVFILKLPDKCISYSCNVESGVKFVKAIDIDAYNPGAKGFTMSWGGWTGKLLGRLGSKDSDETLPKSKALYKKYSDFTFKEYCDGLEEVFMMAKGTESVTNNAENNHTFVLDADLLFNGGRNEPFATFYSPKYTSEQLQLLNEYKSFVQILMLLNKFNGTIDWNDNGLRLLIELLPSKIKGQMTDMSSFTYDSIKQLLPVFIREFIKNCVGTSDFEFMEKGSLRRKKKSTKAKKGKKGKKAKKGKTGRKGRKGKKRKSRRLTMRYRH